jgi:hypothetical protein
MVWFIYPPNISEGLTSALLLPLLYISALARPLEPRLVFIELLGGHFLFNHYVEQLVQYKLRISVLVP